jgi:hypothetical protein
MGTVGVYVRTGPSRRLPRRPKDGHLFISQDGQLHLLSQRDAIVSCSVCGPVHRMRRRDRVTVSSPVRRVLWATIVFLAVFDISVAAMAIVSAAF